jgi:type VI secretion system protein ImpA
MRDAHGYEGAPDLAPLLASLKQIHGLFAEQVATRAALAAAAAGANDGAPDGDAGVASGNSAVIGVGSIRSRDDASRALEAVAEFFRKNEPSSPVPIVVERAKRLISLNFLEVLADMAPDGLQEAKRIGGIRDE